MYQPLGVKVEQRQLAQLLHRRPAVRKKEVAAVQPKPLPRPKRKPLFTDVKPKQPPTPPTVAYEPPLPLYSARVVAQPRPPYLNVLKAH